MSLSNTSVLTKIMAVVGLLALLTVGTNYVALDRMGNIQSEYATLVEKDGQAAVSSMQFARLLVGVGRQTYKVIAQTEAGMMNAAVESATGNVQKIRNGFREFRASQPKYAQEIEDFERRFEEIVQDWRTGTRRRWRS